MSTEQVRETMGAYADALLARADFARFFARDIEFEVIGTGQQAHDAAAAEQAIRFLHEVAFDAKPEIANIVVDDSGAALEAMFVGRHVGEFAGIGATDNVVRVPYSVFYDVSDGAITALRIYMPMDQLLAQIRAPGHAEEATPSA
jgi:predicted ester cyclase